MSNVLCKYLACLLVMTTMMDLTSLSKWGQIPEDSLQQSTAFCSASFWKLFSQLEITSWPSTYDYELQDGPHFLRTMKFNHYYIRGSSIESCDILKMHELLAAVLCLKCAPNVVCSWWGLCYRQPAWVKSESQFSIEKLKRMCYTGRLLDAS